MNSLDLNFASPLPSFEWSQTAQSIAASVSARRGFAAHLLLGRELNHFAQRQADLYAEAVAHRRARGIDEPEIGIPAVALSAATRALALWEAVQGCQALWRDLGDPMLRAAAKELEERISHLAPPLGQCSSCLKNVPAHTLAQRFGVSDRVCPSCLDGVWAKEDDIDAP